MVLKYRTAKEFEEKHLKRIGIDLEQYRHESISLPCTCSYEQCHGWATVRNMPEAIRAHIKEELKRNSGCFTVSEFMHNLSM